MLPHLSGHPGFDRDDRDTPDSSVVADDIVRIITTAARITQFV